MAITSALRRCLGLRYSHHRFVIAASARLELADK
jgi:hypothetical protein